MNRQFFTVVAGALIVMILGVFTGCVLLERDTSLNRFRTACVGLYDTIGLLTADRRSGRMTIEQWDKVNGFAEEGDRVCQDTTIEDFDAALAKVQDARAGIADWRTPMSEIISIILKLIGTFRSLLQLIPSEEQRSAIKNVVAKAIDGDLDESDVQDMLLHQMRSDGKATMDDWRNSRPSGT